ncbi:MAG TPA: rhomboid family intramembrane serine protease [Bacteroidales bacterium]|nr:rhomboid family intramembrane serine protease [Bacteroidales bacterium]
MIIFLVMVFSGLGLISFRGADLLNWGANFRPNVLHGEYWRLFTSTFLHGGLMHLLMNMYGLLFIGLFLEPILKSKRFILLYVITGIIASVSSIWWHTATVSIGASGAIFGMYGIFLALLLTKLFPKDFQKSFLASTLVFVGYNLLYGLTGGIDNAAHTGGLVSGMLIGYLIYPQLKEEREEIK